MEFKIFNSIFSNGLMPIKLDESKILALNTKIKIVGNKKIKTYNDLLDCLEILLSEDKILAKWVNGQHMDNDVELKDFIYTTSFLSYNTPLSKYYVLLINFEALRLLNSFILHYKTIVNIAELKRYSESTLISIKNLTKETMVKAEIFKETPIFTQINYANSLSAQLICQHLKVLYFEIQHLCITSIEIPTSIEDYYLIDLELRLTDAKEIYISNNTKSKIKNNDAISNKHITFGFKDDFEKLKSVVNQLCHQVEFLNKDVSSVEVLLNVFISKSILPNSVKIQIGCETRIFRYIVNKFKPYFHNLTLANIEKSKLFYSKIDNLITANNLSVSNNKNGVEPKEKATIDKIFKQMQ